MNIYPAIDLKDGQCVRLLRGDMDKATVFSDSPGDQAARFAQAGFSWLHIVDLNGAFEGKPVNRVAVKSIMANAGQMQVQLGGGIRNIEMIEDWLNEGISRVILGTVALRNPQLVKQACRLFPDQIAVGIDAKDGKVAVSGWAEVSEQSAIELAKAYEDAGATAIIYTDISRDGAMEGPNVEETVNLAQEVTTPVIASGGISCLDDVKQYKDVELHGIEGVIIGRALYDGAITPDEVLKLC